MHKHPDWLSLAAEALFPLPVDCSFPEDSETVEIDFAPLQTLRPKLKWKGENWSLGHFEALFKDCTAIAREDQVLQIQSDCSADDFHNCFAKLLHLTDLLTRENPGSSLLWPQFFYQRHPLLKGFKKDQTHASDRLLHQLYRDDFVVAEKKPFVIDLEASYKSYMQSLNPEKHCILDAASQIASLSLGFNDDKKNVMALRPEIFARDLQLDKWDVSQAFRHLLLYHSGLKHLTFVNSGSEAVEVALRACQSRYPKRRRVISFKSSFHGRTLLSLHATHNPAKREPFEIFKGLCDFLEFPENKKPLDAVETPALWHETWSESQRELLKKIGPWLNSGDELLKRECEVLMSIHAIALQAWDSGLEDQMPLAILIEPMQCEGGDRYATARFFQALRLMSRAFDIPLVFDEVQSGFGLGGSFFWHHLFDLRDKDGHPDLPDAVCIAKKSQVAACLSQFPQNLPWISSDISPISLYRGYLQAIAIEDFIEDGPCRLASLALKTLLSFQKFIGEDKLLYPRGQGLCFGFDLPSADFLNKMIAVRFEHGLLFYPAGDRTARFRLLVDNDATDMAQLFKSLHACFKAVDASIPDFQKWDAPEEIKKCLQKTSASQSKLWDDVEQWVPENLAAFKAIPKNEWISCFGQLLRSCPQLLRSPMAMAYGVDTLSKLTHEKLWQRYLNEENFTLLDLMFNASRAFGYSVLRHSEQEILAAKEIIEKLEARVYEPIRQDDPLQMAEEARNPRTIFLAAWTHAERRDELMGICIAAPLKSFVHLPMVGTDPAVTDPHALYSMDLTLAPEYQSKGLGLRLKCEQYMEALRQGSTVIRSRNRYPEAKAMTRLNRKLSAVMINHNDKDYGGNATGLYQSIQLFPQLKHVSLADPRLGPARNKTSLANFVSQHYIHHMLFVKKLLPETLRHVYLASGGAEAADKILKLLKTARPQAKVALSLNGDSFGQTTATVRSLGGTKESRLSFFNWPVLQDIEDINRYLLKNSSDEVLGLFVNPMGKSSETLKRLRSFCRQKGFPLIYHETDSAFGNYSKKSFWAADQVTPDAFYLHAGPQLGLAAVTAELFLKSPLAMISTWDGDESGLAQFCRRALDALASK